MSDEAKNVILNKPPFIVWELGYSLGIHIVDEHHRGILAAINSFNYEIQRQQGDSVLEPIFNIVREYTRTHFKIEEEFFEKFNFPDTASHRELHNDMMDMLSRAGVQSALSHDPEQLMEFLKKWWIDHICTKDREFRDFLLGE